MTAASQSSTAKPGAGAVFRNPVFLRLWLAQAATQIGGNMVLFGLTIIVSQTGSSTAVSLLILTFLVPAVLLSAVAGVYVDRVDRRLILIFTNVLRGFLFLALYFVGGNLALILLLNIAISTAGVFFAPAEAAMIPVVVPRKQLLAANGIFTLTLNAAFALGFALLGPLIVNIADPEVLILMVALLFFVATALCFTLPSVPPVEAPRPDTHPGRLGGMVDAERAVESTLHELREGLDFIRSHRTISWSLLYLGITASLVGVLGVLGPAFARTTLGLQSKDFAVVVLPLGFGIVMGILLLNAYGQYLPRRRVIEGGLIALGALLALLALAGPISRLLQRADAATGLLDLGAVTSLLGVVVVIAFLAGIAYAMVAIPSQTQLQEDLPEDVRGRVFGVLNMLVSIASFVPIILVGSIADLVGTTIVILTVSIVVLVIGIYSWYRRGPLLAIESERHADMHAVDPLAAALGADRPTWQSPDDADEEVVPAPLAPNPGAGAPSPTAGAPAPTTRAVRRFRTAMPRRPRMGRGRPQGS
ncbi:MAG: MFS transporter [Chloroflexota bacterium]